MKILMVTDKMDIGGAETHILTLIRELASSGESVTLLSAGGVYADSLRKRGVRVIYSPLDKRDPFSFLECKKILKYEMKKCDIVHTHTRFTSFLAGKIRGKGSFPPIVTTAHLNFKMFPFGKLAFWGERTLAVSEDIKEYLSRNYNIPDDKISLTRNAINTNIYSRERLPKKVIIHTSRIDKGRSLTAFLLCECAKTLLKRHPGFRILIVGDGNKFCELKRKAKAVNLSLGYEGVILTGARYDIPSILRYGAIFVGVSRSALEGMAAGLPTIICGDEGYGGIASKDNFDLLLKTNFCARGLERANLNKLTADIELLINDRKKSEELSDFSKNILKSEFSATQMVNDAKCCYNLTRRPPSIALAGYFGYNNLGDETILKEALLALKELGITDISLLTANGKSNALSREYFDCFDTLRLYDRMSFNELRKAIDRADILILCGGNLLQNETSERSLMYYSEIIRYAGAKKLRIYMLSSGFGGVNGALGRYLLRKSIASADYCGCRTHYDLEIAKEYCRNSKFMPDLCFLLDEKTSHIDKNSFCWIVSKKSLIQTDEILRIAAKRKLRPIAVLLNYPEDKCICNKLVKSNIIYYIPTGYESFSNIIASCAFSVSERLHGAIFSILCHTPAYLTSETPKKEALISEVSKLLPNSSILLPYKMCDVLNKKEIGAQDSDFNDLISYAKHEIKNALRELF